MTLELIKVEEGLMAGDVLYHSFLSKTKAEVKEIKKNKQEKHKLKISRKRIQEANVAKKKAQLPPRKRFKQADEEQPQEDAE